MVMEGKTGKFNYIVASMLNALSSNQASGMSTDTLNCDVDSIAKVESEDKVFVASNYENLSEDISQGKGEYLAAYGMLLGCSDENIDEFSKMTQENYEVIFSGDHTVNDVISRTKILIASNLAGKCTL